MHAISLWFWPSSKRLKRCLILQPKWVRLSQSYCRFQMLIIYY